MDLKQFYEEHKNFSYRTLTEYYISPGIRCKFDILKKILKSKKSFKNAIDLGSSGNSFLNIFENATNKSFYDIADLPLKSYTKKSTKELTVNNFTHYWHPVCGDIAYLPYRNESFDFVCALDVLEHIKNDRLAIFEISRITKKGGLAIISVPHKMKFYSKQDYLIGHYRRYEVNQIIALFEKCGMKSARVFGVYGRIMRIADIQSRNPKSVEKQIIELRNRYESSIFFRKFWDIIVGIGSIIMKIDVIICPLRKMMNVALIFVKN